MNLSKDKELFLLLSRVKPDNAALHRARSLMTPQPDWDSFTALVSHHGTAPIVFKNLLKLMNIPQEVMTTFENIYNLSLRTNILMVNELDRIIDALNRDGIEVISLKGSTTSEKIFGDIGLYCSTDIDILLKIQDIDGVRRILEADGYRLNDVGFDENREFFLRELYHISLSNEQFTIEPHWNLFLRYFTTPPEFWWDESTTVTSGDRQYRFLSPEKNILYTSFRLFSKGFTHLRFLLMVAEVVRYYHKTVNWEKLFAYAKKYRFENTLRLIMNLCHEFLGAPVPQQYREIKSLRAKVLSRRAGEMVFIEDGIHPLNKAIFAFLRDDLTGASSVLMRRLFPSMGEVISRYRLQEGSFKAKMYYLFNPLFLILRKHQR